MTDEFNMLDAVMLAIGLKGNDYQKDTIQLYINEVEQYLLNAGVSEDLIGTEQTAGIVARGVLDLWNYNAGAGRLSTYFKERAIQLSLEGGAENAS